MYTMYVHARACVRKVFKCVCLCSNNKALLTLSDHRHSLALFLSLALYTYTFCVFHSPNPGGGSGGGDPLYTKVGVYLNGNSQTTALLLYFKRLPSMYIHLYATYIIYNVHNTLCI